MDGKLMKVGHMLCQDDSALGHSVPWRRAWVNLSHQIAEPKDLEVSGLYPWEGRTRTSKE